MEGEIRYGVIYDPLTKELFTAEKGTGAYLNGNPLRVSSTQSLNSSLLCTGFPYDIRQDLEGNLRHFRGFLMRAQAIRRDGTAALDLCYTAAGRFDGFWEQKLRPWDVAAGSLMVTEAGGTVSDYQGKPFSIYALKSWPATASFMSRCLRCSGKSREYEIYDPSP